MKKTSKILVAMGVLVIGGAAQAQWTYFDVTDGLYHSDAANYNTFNVADDSPYSWSNAEGSGDGLPTWRFRDGPGGPGDQAWDTINGGAAGSAFSGFYGNGGPDPTLYTVLTGLAANTSYKVRLYAVFPRNITNENIYTRSRNGANFSVDGGSTWTQVSAFNEAVNPLQLVDNDSAIGTDLTTAPTTGDQRLYTTLQAWLTTDGAGTARIYVTLPQYLEQPDGTPVLQDRMHIDGYAVAVPEPTTFALAGVGMAALLIFRRRR